MSSDAGREERAWRAPRHAPPDVRRTDESVDRFADLLTRMGALLDGSLRAMISAHGSLRAARGVLGTGAVVEAEDRLAEACAQLDRVAELVHGSLQGPGLSLGSELLSGCSPVTLSAAVEHALELVGPRCELDNIRVKVSMDGATGQLPAGPLFTVLLHGLRNAIESIASASARRGTREGGMVTLRVRREACGRKGAERVVIQIVDDGVGLPADVAPADLPRSGFSTKGPGRGLGLCLCRMLVERAGGSLALANNDGAGATLTVLVPVTPGARRLLPGSDGR